ncbi:MAG: 1-deoxy-D-xylulose-5-phosphate synthase [Caldisericia bacterium]|nr:1-deoxy-D-xylulose-5-phosphate synthase [Caldisericia bacterium]MDD4614285.1 1-deoxy-D-xylulose-5-phosphate synthase [Caldisericia bacterium]
MNFTAIPSLTYSELQELCTSVREKIIETVSKNGGHLSSNLGVVELTVALLRVFHPEKDDFLFDVGHQCYTYKLLTDRWDQFYTLRQENGISGYPNIQESKSDKFIAGHSGTSLSIAFGFAYAKKLLQDPSHTIAIVGDGSFTSGENFEAINCIGHHKLPIIIVLNDNEMSISRNVGYLSHELDRLRNSVLYRIINNRTKSQLCKMGSIGKKTVSFLERVKMATKKFFIPRSIFEEFGIAYFGPYNGHNIEVLSEIFHQIRKQNKPCLVHVVTKKGKGISHFENNSTQFHSSPPFVMDKECIRIADPKKTFSSYFGEALLENAKRNPKMVALTAAMSEGLHMVPFANEYPSRFIDVGIAEQCLVSTAAGLAHKKFIPIVGIYSTFLQRAYDQVIHDCCIQSEPLLFAIDRAGAVSGDGPTHQGSFDIAFLLPLPNVTIMAPSNGTELKDMVQWSLQNLHMPTFIRYPKETTSSVIDSCPIQLGKSVHLEEGTDGYIIFVGPFENLSRAVREKCLQKNLHIGIVNARFIKPFDKQMFQTIASNCKKIVILEDGIQTGGFAQMVQSYLCSLPQCGCKITSLGLKEHFLGQQSRASILKNEGFTVEHILEMLENDEAR